jgi:hypothetical protein
MAKATGLVVYALALVLFAAFVAVPFLGKKRDIPAAVPSPPPLVATDLVVLKPSDHVCMTGLAISKQSRQVRFRAGTYHKPGPALAVTVKAAGYSGTSASVAAGWEDNALLSVPIPALPSARLGTVCIRNQGKVKIALYAAADQAHSRVHVFVDGKQVYPTPTLVFAEAKPVSLADRAGVTAGRIAVFRGFLDHAWVVWVLAIAALVVVPMLVALALSSAQRRSDSSAG